MEMLTKKKVGIVAIPIVALAAFTLAIVFLTDKSDGIVKDQELDMPMEYRYEAAVSSNGMELKYVVTRPSNIHLEAVHNNVTLAPFYGINGGFFYQNELLSIAMVNDVPVNVEVGSYGFGKENVKYARGTLVWDGRLDKLSVQVVRQASEIDVTDRTRYWAQGGISMSLERDDLWLNQIAAENAPLPIDFCLRSAAVYDTDGNLYLIVSTTRGPLADFRQAIMEEIGNGKLENGIFLDGDGSSQLRSREAKHSGDGRPVVQMMSLVR